MNSTLKQLLYVSVRSEETNEADIRSILKTSQQFNNENEIRGVLVSLPCHFFQLLEGPVSAIDYLMNRILQDKRHHNVDVISERSIKQYCCGVWSMLHYNVDSNHADYFWLLENMASQTKYNKSQVDGLILMLSGLTPMFK